MRTKALGCLAGLVALALFTSCATTGVGPSQVGAADVKTEVTDDGPSVDEILHYDGPKARIAIGSFEVKAGKADGTIGSGMQEMLIDSLFKTNRFIVLERASLKDLQSEFELGEGEWAAGAPERGTFETADILLSGAITAFEPDYKGKGGGGIVIPLPWVMGAGVKVGRTDAYIAANIRLVDVRTRRIIKTGTVEGLSSSSSFGIIGGGLLGAVALGGGFQSYQNTPMEKAVMIMLENAIREIVKSIPEDYYRHTDK
jgi:curli biogenesis system outer membrane secretion channel CsgG